MKAHVMLASAMLAVAPAIAANVGNAVRDGITARAEPDGKSGPASQAGRANGAGDARPAESEAGSPGKLTRFVPLEMKPAPGGGPGKVWVNTQARVYHCQDDPLYGRTRKGTYMSEARARAPGARPLMDRACS